MRQNLGWQTEDIISSVHRFLWSKAVGPKPSSPGDGWVAWEQFTGQMRPAHWSHPWFGSSMASQISTAVLCPWTSPASDCGAVPHNCLIQHGESCHLAHRIPPRGVAGSLWTCGTVIHRASLTATVLMAVAWPFPSQKAIPRVSAAVVLPSLDY